MVEDAEEEAWVMAYDHVQILAEFVEAAGMGRPQRGYRRDWWWNAVMRRLGRHDKYYRHRWEARVARRAVAPFIFERAGESKKPCRHCGQLVTWREGSMTPRPHECAPYDGRAA